MPSGMIVNQVTSMTGQVEVVAMEGRMTVHIAVLSAQCTEGHDLVLTMAVQRVLSMVHMAGAGVLFVIAIEADLLSSAQDPQLPTEEVMTDGQLSRFMVARRFPYAVLALALVNKNPSVPVPKLIV